MPPYVRKVYAYITQGPRLLIFRHVDKPDVALQVPGGTVEPGEPPEVAVMREAREETGRDDLRLVGFLGETQRDLADWGIDGVHHRFYYHLTCDGQPPETWRQAEWNPSDGSPAPIWFELFWSPLPDGVPPLGAHQDEMLPALLRQLRLFP